jgi:hypothetical protein
MQEYFNAKQQLFIHSNVCYTTSEVYNQLAQIVTGKTKIYETIYDLSITQFVGKHNEKNCALTFEVVKKSYELLVANHENIDEKIREAI